MRKNQSINETNPDIAKEWHPTKNGDLMPSAFTQGSGKEVWWLYSYDDPRTGKHWDFEWEARIADRCKKGYGCPQLANRKVEKGFNDLGSLYPDLAKQWDYELNGSVTPYDILARTHDKYHWVYPYDDPKTGKHWDFRWEASVDSRVGLGRGCPQLSNQKIEVGFNDLATTNPEVARLWDYESNGDTTPQDIFLGSKKKYHWVYPYDDPQTGKHWDFKWEARCYDIMRSQVCPQLTGKKVEIGFNDLATTNPETAALWDYELNNPVTPFDVTKGSDKKYHWIYPYDDPKTNKHWDFRSYAKISDAIKWSTCPQLAGKQIEVGFNDLGSLYPELAKQWDYKQNHGLSPFDVFALSNKYYYWIYPYDDPKTGKHWDFRWRAKASNRVNFPTCPFLINRELCVGFNDFATLYPELAKEWHPTKNGELTPSKVCGAPYLDVWWLYKYDNPKNGKHYEYSWKAAIVNRVKGTGCPYLPPYESNGEKIIRQYLSEKNMDYDIQKSFDGLVGVKERKLTFDFAVYLNNRCILIEYQGIQHYEPVDFDGKGEENALQQFMIQQEHDKRKKGYAKKNHYPLIEIKYTLATYDEIAEYLDKKLRLYTTV